MKVLRATTEQYNALNGYRNGNSVLQFTEDAAGNWIVGKSVLTDIAFLAIRPQLEQLEEIDHNPIVEEVGIDSIFLYSTLSGIQGAVDRIKFETGADYQIYRHGTDYAIKADEVSAAHTSKVAQAPTETLTLWT